MTATEYLDRLAKFFGKFIPETRWGMAEGGRAKVTTSEERVLRSGWREIRSCKMVR